MDRVREISESELNRLKAMSQWEVRLKAKGYTRIAGVDEAGRGPLAGPVVAAACILPEGALFANLNDSKQLTPELRDVLFEEIINYPNLIYSVGIIGVKKIDKINILQASLLAMKKAIAGLSMKPDFILIDGNQLPRMKIPKEAIVEGDGASISIAAASIIAKVTRDRIMIEFDAKWPKYGFKQHKGYATEEHIAAIQRHGPCSIHRKSFDPVKSILNPSTEQNDPVDAIASEIK